ncbi:MAG: glutaredoxin [Lacticaseibacillus paracasei]
MAIHFVIYEKPNCESCRLTKRWLAEHGQHFRTTNHRGESNLVVLNANDPLKRAWSHQKIVKFREAGYDRFPVVRVRDDATGDVLATWSGFRPEALASWTAINQLG